jgi:hypothetical protein
LGIVRTPRIDNPDIKSNTKILLKNARGIRDTPIDLQTPISSLPELLIRHDFKVNNADRLTLRERGLKRNNDE